MKLLVNKHYHLHIFISRTNQKHISFNKQILIAICQNFRSQQISRGEPRSICRIHICSTTIIVADFEKKSPRNLLPYVHTICDIFGFIMNSSRHGKVSYNLCKQFGLKQNPNHAAGKTIPGSETNQSLNSTVIIHCTADRNYVSRCFPS